MIRRLMIAAGFGAGYVLGAKAGTQRYEQIMAKGREFAGKPAVQDLKTQVTATVSDVAELAKDTVNDTVQAVSDKVDSAKSGDTVDLSSTARPPVTGSGPTPMPTATPSARPAGTLPPTSPTPPTPPRPATTPSVPGAATPPVRPAPAGTTPPAAPRRPNS